MKTTPFTIIMMVFLAITSMTTTSCDKSEIDDIEPTTEFCWECMATKTTTDPGNPGVWIIDPNNPGQVINVGYEPPTTSSFDFPSYIVCDATADDINEIIQDAYINQTIGGINYLTKTKCEKQ